MPHDVTYLQNVAGPNVALYGAHGTVGEITATDNPDVARTLMANDREVIMTVRFAGATAMAMTLYALYSLTRPAVKKYLESKDP